MCNFSIVEADQKKRAEAGKKLIKKLSMKGSAATFSGSGKNPYQVSLDGCSCGDWIRHHKACKHMFALAYKLKVI